MANILIKEVADVTFYEIDENGEHSKPVLYLDTLKVSTIEQTAETVDARGGKGNPKLITWDYGKEITVTIEDALFSAKSMAVMFGNGKVAQTSGSVEKVVTVRATSSKLPDYFVADVYDSATKRAERKKVFVKKEATDGGISLASSGLTLIGVYNEEGESVNVTGSTAWDSFSATQGNKYFVKYSAKANKKEIVISADSFPGTYYVTGDTYARSDVSGKDQFFQFIIQKAKMSSENTITLEAEGDPSTFSMNLTVLRPEDGEMMKLVQYDLTGAEG